MEFSFSFFFFKKIPFPPFSFSFFVIFKVLILSSIHFFFFKGEFSLFGSDL